VVTPGEEIEFRDWIDSGEPVTPSANICGLSGRCSVGVGGVTVVAGAGMAVWGGVFGRGLASRERGFGSVKSVRMGAGTGIGGTFSWAAFARFDDRLLRRLPPNILRLLLLAPDFDDARSLSSLLSSCSLSSSSFFFSFSFSFLSDVLKASLKRLPGEALRRLLLESPGMSSVILDWIPCLGTRSSESDLSEPVALGPLAADSGSPCVPWLSAASTEVVLMRGEEEV
jgi:hypothetical protein